MDETKKSEIQVESADSKTPESAEKQSERARNDDLWSPQEARQGSELERSSENSSERRASEGEDRDGPIEQIISGANEAYGADQRDVHGKYAETREAIDSAQGLGDALDATAKGLEFAGEATASFGDGVRESSLEGFGEAAEELAKSEGASELEEMALSVAGETVEMLHDVIREASGATITGVGEAAAGVGRAAESALEAVDKIGEGDEVGAKHELIDAGFQAAEDVSGVAEAALKGAVKGAAAGIDGISEIARELIEGAGEVSGAWDDEESDGRR